MTGLISPLLDSVILVALARSPELHQRWTDFFVQLSAYTSDPERMEDGRMDLVLRALEAETRDRIKATGNVADSPFGLQMQVALSRYWLLSMYEVLRRAHETDQGRAHAELGALRRRIEMVRVPLAKSAIANDGRLRDP